MTDLPVLTIRIANEAFEDYLLNGDFTFSVQGYAEVQVDTPVASWPVDVVEAFDKDYGLDSDAFSERRQSGNATVLVAWLGEEAVGHMVLRCLGNGFAHIDELAVDIPARRNGVARALLDWACRWSRQHELAGVMLETQNNNLDACRLYERCGFVVGGTDRLAYRGIDPHTREVAIFWYLIFPAN